MPRRFVPTLDIWTLTDAERRTLQPGQWVSAGTPDATRSNCGRFWGVRSKGPQILSTVVAWNGNARSADDWRSYQRTLRDYALGGR